MTKIKKILLLVFLLLLVIAICFVVNSKKVTAETVEEKAAVSATGEAGIEPYGLYVKMGYSLYGENGQIRLSATNKFTLFPSTVTVYIYLYRSETYQESHTNMTLVASNYIYDLDQGETLVATASTEGRSSYWKAVCRHKRDNSNWEEYISETTLCNADGMPLI